MNIIFIGPEGSGKGTQAGLLSAKLHIPHITTGDILRNRMHEESEVGELIRTTFGAGGYLPDDVVNGILLERLKEPDCQGGFIVDGFPRSMAQAEALDIFLKANNQKIDHTILIEISEEETFKRLSLRKRFDDTPEKIKSRLAAYNERVAPLLAYYEKENALRKVNGEQSVDDVQKAIVALIG